MIAWIVPLLRSADYGFVRSQTGGQRRRGPTVRGTKVIEATKLRWSTEVAGKRGSDSG